MDPNFPQDNNNNMQQSFNPMMGGGNKQQQPKQSQGNQGMFGTVNQVQGNAMGSIPSGMLGGMMVNSLQGIQGMQGGMMQGGNHPQQFPSFVNIGNNPGRSGNVNLSSLTPVTFNQNMPNIQSGSMKNMSGNSGNPINTMNPNWSSNSSANIGNLQAKGNMNQMFQNNSGGGNFPQQQFGRSQGVSPSMTSMPQKTNQTSGNESVQGQGQKQLQSQSQSQPHLQSQSQSQSQSIHGRRDPTTQRVLEEGKTIVSYILHLVRFLAIILPDSCIPMLESHTRSFMEGKSTIKELRSGYHSLIQENKETIPEMIQKRISAKEITYDDLIKVFNSEMKQQFEIARSAGTLREYFTKYPLGTIIKDLYTIKERELRKAQERLDQEQERIHHSREEKETGDSELQDKSQDNREWREKKEKREKDIKREKKDGRKEKKEKKDEHDESYDEESSFQKQEDEDTVMTDGSSGQIPSATTASTNYETSEDTAMKDGDESNAPPHTTTEGAEGATAGTEAESDEPFQKRDDLELANYLNLFTISMIDLEKEAELLSRHKIGLRATERRGFSSSFFSAHAIADRMNVISKQNGLSPVSEEVANQLSMGVEYHFRNFIEELVKIARKRKNTNSRDVSTFRSLFRDNMTDDSMDSSDDDNHRISLEDALYVIERDPILVKYASHYRQKYQWFKK